MNTLKPCPWANLGGPHTLRINTNRGYTSVRCGCGASGPGNFTAELAEEAWNSWADSSAQQVAIDRIKDLYRGDDGQAWDEARKYLESVGESEFLNEVNQLSVSPAQSEGVPSVKVLAELIASAKREYNVLHGGRALPDYSRGETSLPLVFAADFIAEKIRAHLTTMKSALSEDVTPSGGVDHPESILANILNLTAMTSVFYNQGGMGQVREWIMYHFKEALRTALSERNTTGENHET